jgi:cytochrome c biogenesis protein
MAENKPSENIISSIWKFFASVQIAIVTLSTISLVSIIGTVIPQKEAPEWYIQQYGPNLARFFDLFHLGDMFGSIWFKALLCLLSANLIICSIDRFPGVWKQIVSDNTKTPAKRLKAMKRSATWTAAASATVAAEHFTGFLSGKGWKIQSAETEEGLLLSGQKGAWTRLGVFLVHGAILVILVGAIIGSTLGFKGFASILEGQSIGKVSINNSGASVNLGFQVRCDGFNIDYYANGMPKEYRSDLTILEKGKEVLHKAIKVNSPLTYKGITFYQSSYQAYKDFLLSITDTTTGKEKTFMVPFQKELPWKAEGLRFGVINDQATGEKITRIKIWLSDPSGPPSIFWMDAGSQKTLKRNGKRYLILGEQLYSTGLQVAKDPGVWWVYVGCALILFGLFVAFFTSHRRIWLLLTEKGGTATIYMAGSTNKNKTGFDKSFYKLSKNLENLKE